MIEIIKLNENISLDQTMYLLGQVPRWLAAADSGRSARDIINEGYAFGGWKPLKGAKLGRANAMTYPGDPPQYPYAEIRFGNERVFAYPHEFWGIVQADGTAEFARLD